MVCNDCGRRAWLFPVLLVLLLVGCSGTEGTALRVRPTVTSDLSASAPAEASTPAEATPTVVVAPSQPAPSPVPTVAPSAPTLAVSPAVSPAATATEIGTAPATQVVLPEPPRAALLYICNASLCTAPATGDGPDVLVRLEPDAGEIGSFALSADGTAAVYSLEGGAAANVATLYLIATAGGQPRRLFDVRLLEDGIGDLSGGRVLGLSAGNDRVIFEDGAQVFVSALDASDRRAVTPVLPYGASTSHSFALSPDRTKLLVISGEALSSVVLYDVADGTEQMVELEATLSPAAFGADADHLVAYRLDRPYDPAASHGTNLSRTVTGYELVALTDQGSRPLAIDPAYRPAADAVGGQLLFARQEGETPDFHLLDLASGEFVPVPVPEIP